MCTTKCQIELMNKIRSTSKEVFHLQRIRNAARASIKTAGNLSNPGSPEYEEREREILQV